MFSFIQCSSRFLHVLGGFLVHESAPLSEIHKPLREAFIDTPFFEEKSASAETILRSGGPLRLYFSFRILITFQNE